jgi:hypothetical protein
LGHFHHDRYSVIENLGASASKDGHCGVVLLAGVLNEERLHRQVIEHKAEGVGSRARFELATLRLTVP